MAVENNINRDDEQALHDEDVYHSQRSGYVKRRDELGDIFDKGRVALAGGAIALSVAVLKDLIPKADSGTRTAIGIGWAFLAICLIMSLLCVYLAAVSHGIQVDIIDDDRRAALGQCRIRANRRNPLSVAVDWMNPLSVVFLLAGLIVMGVAIFGAVSNVPTSHNKETAMSNEKKSGNGKETTKTLSPKGTPVTKQPSGGNSSGNDSNGAKK